MLKTTDPCIVTEGWSGLVPMPDRLARWVTALGLFALVQMTLFDRVLVHASVSRVQEADWCLVDFKDLFTLH